MLTMSPATIPWFGGAERDRRLAGQDAGPGLDARRRGRGPRRRGRAPARTARSASSSWAIGRAPHRHDRVADELLDRAAVAADDLADGLEVAGLELADLLGVAALGERGEPDEVGEQDADEAALGDGVAWRRGAGGDAAAAGRQPRRGPRAPRQRRRALGAELGRRQVRRRRSSGRSTANGVAHSMQNLAPGRFSVPQFEQITRASSPVSLRRQALRIAEGVGCQRQFGRRDRIAAPKRGPAPQ